ncbi:hypothetical protein JXO59_07185 [candidate division KSB1 bacterium]|nr:hypothetical protein [candidate division KSB1 bacterium]
MQVNKLRHSVVILLLIAFGVFAQPEHNRLIYSHYLDSGRRTMTETVINKGGKFLPGQGWQADDSISQLQILFGKPLPSEGTLAIRVTNFDPTMQVVPELKQHIINLYSQIASNNKEVYETDASWANIRTHELYSSAPGRAGLKFLCAPHGKDSRRRSL